MGFESHVKLLEDISCVLGLMDEGTLRALLDLLPKEKPELTHEAHLKLPAHLFSKTRQQSVR